MFKSAVEILVFTLLFAANSYANNNNNQTQLDKTIDQSVDAGTTAIMALSEAESEFNKKCVGENTPDNTDVACNGKSGYKYKKAECSSVKCDAADSKNSTCGTQCQTANTCCTLEETMHTACDGPQAMLTVTCTNAMTNYTNCQVDCTECGTEDNHSTDNYNNTKTCTKTYSTDYVSCIQDAKSQAAKVEQRCQSLCRTMAGHRKSSFGWQDATSLLAGISGFLTSAGGGNSGTANSGTSSSALGTIAFGSGLITTAGGCDALTDAAQKTACNACMKLGKVYSAAGGCDENSNISDLPKNANANNNNNNAAALAGSGSGTSGNKSGSQKGASQFGNNKSAAGDPSGEAAGTGTGSANASGGESDKNSQYSSGGENGEQLQGLNKEYAPSNGLSIFELLTKALAEEAKKTKFMVTKGRT